VNIIKKKDYFNHNNSLRPYGAVRRQHFHGLSDCNNRKDKAIFNNILHISRTLLNNLGQST